MDRNYRNPVFILEIQFSASEAFSYHLPKCKRTVKYAALPHNLSFLPVRFCLKYSLVTGGKLHAGASTGTGLKVIKFLPGAGLPGSRWRAILCSSWHMLLYI